MMPAAVWGVKITPYYTAIENYIGVVAICGPECSGMPASQLMFANHQARLYGLDMAESYTLSSGPAGVVRLTGSGGFVSGQDQSTHTDLYHMMPLHQTLAVDHHLGGWSSALELAAVGRKRAVDVTRNEPQTSGYVLLNARTAFEAGAVRLDAGVRNLLDRRICRSPRRNLAIGAVSVHLYGSHLSCSAGTRTILRCRHHGEVLI